MVGLESAQAYIDRMKSAPYLQPWRAKLETYYKYGIERMPGGVKTNIDPSHIVEESMTVRTVDCASYYWDVQRPVLILRAKKGLFSLDDILLPEDVIQRMVDQIPDAQRVDVSGVNHYGIVFQPHVQRDVAVRAFLS